MISRCSGDCVEIREKKGKGRGGIATGGGWLLSAVERRPIGPGAGARFLGTREHSIGLPNTNALLLNRSQFFSSILLYSPLRCLYAELGH